jgi:hypothetical protein
MKYVVLLVKKPEFKVPIIFPDMLVHSDVADHMKHMLSVQHKFDDVEVFSAGFIENGKCYGKSTSLGVESHESDTLLIKTYSYTQGMV